MPRPVPQASAAPATRQESPRPGCTRHQSGPGAPLPDTGLPGAQAARPSVPGRGASWEQEYRDLKAAIFLRNYSPRTLEAYRFWIAKLLGHSDIKTTMIYLQTVPSLTLKEAKSPLDLDPTLTPARS